MPRIPRFFGIVQPEKNGTLQIFYNCVRNLRFVRKWLSYRRLYNTMYGMPLVFIRPEKIIRYIREDNLIVYVPNYEMQIYCKTIDD